MKNSRSNRVKIVLKPWGREIWFAHTTRYAGKILELRKGHRFSLQYHEKKMETQYLLSGRMKFSYGPYRKNVRSLHLKSKILKPGDKVDIPPYTIHRAQALSDSAILEVSTPELDDVVKLADDYGRMGRGNNFALDRALARKTRNRMKS